MEIPGSLYGEEYIQSLRRFRDAALEESFWRGRRRQLGRFSIGSIHALWRAEDGSHACLSEEGLSYGSSSLTRAWPTRLLLVSRPTENGMLVQKYRMDLEDGLIDTSTSLHDAPTLSSIFHQEISRFRERRHGVDVPTDEQRELLFNELQRGSSGLYRNIPSQS